MCGALSLLLAGAMPAQTLTLQNLAPFPRAEWCAVVVPFARGAVPDLPALHVVDSATVWQPFGARWPDGSRRQALCLFRLALPSLGERQVQLAAGEGPPLPASAIAWPTAALRFSLSLPGDAPVVTATPQPVEMLEQNAARQVMLLRARLGDSGLLAEVIVTAWRDQPHADADLAVFASDPRSPAMQVAVRELAVDCRGMALLLRHPGRLAVQQTTTATGSHVVLLHDTVLGDGQGIRRAGVLLPPLHGNSDITDRTAQAAAVCPVLGATGWSDSGSFGAFGLVPPPPPWLAGGLLRAALAERHRAFVAGDQPANDPFWNGPFGLARGAGQTGDQQDFGTVKLSAVAFAALPSLLLEAEPSVLQEACRPVHCFEADGALLRAVAHADWVVWSGRTHWHPEVSKDRLGKPAPEPPYDSHGWSGKDREHWSSNYLGAYALLTGAHWARRELAHEVQLYLGGETTRPDLSTSHGGAPRGAGRTELAACWMYLATGDAALLQRMHERLDQVYFPEWAGRTLDLQHVRPFGVQEPDPRMLQGKARYWSPWQEAIAAVGFGASFRVTGNKHAQELAEALACNVVRHGYKLDDRECIIATALAWNDGVPLTAAQLASGDPGLVLWSYGTAFTEWAMGAVEIARVAAAAAGDEALRARAEAIQLRVRGGRQRPGDGFYDRLTEWDAVRW